MTNWLQLLILLRSKLSMVMQELDRTLDGKHYNSGIRFATC